MTLYRQPFDIVISFDTTGSMYSCLDNVKRNMRNMIKKLKSKIPDIQIGVIAHGDYDTDHTYVIKYEDLTSSTDNLCSFVMAAKGTGAGRPAVNLDEAYELSLWYSRNKMSWRPNSSKTLVMIGDCRPHEVGYFLSTKRIDWKREIIYLRDMNVKIYAVQCEDMEYADSFYQKIASTTFGHHVALDDFRKIEGVLVSICFRETNLGIAHTSDASPEVSVPQPMSDFIHPSSQVINEHSDDETDEESQDERNGMVCPMCAVAKPPDEFPSTNVSDDCNHAPLECLRVFIRKSLIPSSESTADPDLRYLCVVKHVNENGKCPAEGCEVKVEPTCTMMKFFEAKLDTMFLDYSKHYGCTSNYFLQLNTAVIRAKDLAVLFESFVVEEAVIEKRSELLRESGEYISVSTINGDTEWFPYDENTRIGDLKRQIEQKLTLKVEQQRLVYNNTNLKADAKLSDYNIGCSANISLIVPLYCIPEHLDHVVFDLSWEFPSVNPDFLDASCMAFEKDEFVQVIDWTHSSNKYYLNDSVKHSEKNLTGPGAITGHQMIHVYLKQVPRNITHLYFTLSSWRSPNLSQFRNPSLKFYEASSENVNLCETTFVHALDSQAVIMCSAVRAGTKWQIFDCGSGSLVSGNAKRYNPIRARIAELIQNEL